MQQSGGDGQYRGIWVFKAWGGIVGEGLDDRLQVPAEIPSQLLDLLVGLLDHALVSGYLHEAFLEQATPLLDLLSE